MGARSEEMPLPKPASALADTAAVDLKSELRTRIRRKMFRRMKHYVPGFAPICCDTNDAETQMDGLRKRLLRDQNPLDAEMLKRFGRFVQEFLEQNLVPLEARPLFEEWLDQTSYNEARKQELRDAFASLRGGRPTRRESRKISSFGKTESYPAYKFLRWINSRNDRMKAYLGPLTKAVEERLYNLPWFIKHVPVPDRPAALKSLVANGLRYILTDYTSFEASFCPAFQNECEVRLHRHMLSNVLNPDELEFVLGVHTGKNHLRTRLGVSCTVEGKRMSGDMWTSCDNGFSNLMITLFLASEKGLDVKGFVEGDDGIFAIGGGMLEASDYAKLGFSIKLAEVDAPTTMRPVCLDDEQTASLTAGLGFCPGAFCGIICSEDGSIIRDPRYFLSSFGWTSSFIHAGPRIMDELTRAKALSAAYETPQCPIIGALARRALADTRHVRPRWDPLDTYHAHPSDELNVPEFNPSLETRQLFEQHFGVPIAVQLQVEQRFMAGNMQVSDLVCPTADMLHYSSRYVEAT